MLVAAALVALGISPASKVARVGRHANGSSTCALLDGVNVQDARGGLQSIAGVTSPAVCCGHCGVLPGCASWTVYEATCYLKGPIVSHSNCSDCFSGSLGGSGPAPQCTVLLDVDASPDDAGLAQYVGLGNDTGACCGLCSAFPGCLAWTLYEGKCFLKPGFERATAASGVISGYLGGGPLPAPPAPAPLPRPWAHRGMTFTGGRYCPDVAMGSAASLQSLTHLASTGASHVAIVVTQYQWTIDDTDIFPLYNASQVYDEQNNGYYKFVTLTAAQLRAGIRHAHSLGLRVLLKPHIDLLRNNKPTGEFWRGDVGTNFNASQWDAWFASYEAFLVPYAALAQAEGVEILCVGTELAHPNQGDANAGRWRALLADKVRPAYSGLLTAAAIDGWEERLSWWDAVDIIGIDAYYGIPGDSTAEMARGWQQWVVALGALSAQWQKNITFTEIGYCSGKCSRDHTPTKADEHWHAMHYAAVFEAFRDVPWFLGAFWWNWDTDPGSFEKDDCLTPQFKEAEDVLRSYYRTTIPKPPPPGFKAKCIGDGKCTC